MKLKVLFIFITAFTLDFRLRASDGFILETPEKCSESEGFCVFKVQNSKYHYDKNGVSISMAKDSVLIRQKEREFSFVSGKLLVQAKRALVFDTPYGHIQVQSDSVVIVEKSDDKFIIQSIFGKTHLKPLGSKKHIIVAQGYENYIAPVNESLVAQTGIPKPILIEPFLKSWASLTSAKKNQFLEQVENFKPIHQKAVEELSILNEQITSREIASVRAEKIAQEERRKRLQEERRQRQEMYYNRLLSY
jgi:hypothetical protein